MSLLEFHSVKKQFGTRTALEGLTLYVAAGEIYGFLGPNGAGKTTAIHLAMGFLRPTSGGGLLAGRPFGDYAAHGEVGFVPDAPVFLGGTAMDALRLAGTLHGLRSTEVRDRSLDLLELLELPLKGDVRKFSRGMQQRLALAQALLHRPKLLLLDEPTSALDPPSVIAVRRILRQARGEGTAVFLSSHQLVEVEQLCDRIGFLRAGHMIRTGHLHELLSEDATVEIVVRNLHEDSEAAAPWSPRALESGRRKVLMLLAPASRQREAIEAAWSAGAELVSVIRQRQSLEDLFARLELAAWPPKLQEIAFQLAPVDTADSHPLAADTQQAGEL